MNYFKIFAHGKKFNVDKFIEKSSLKIDYFWKIGDQKRYAPTDIPSPHETSGIEIVLGEGTKLNRFDQDAIAVEFMEENLGALKELSGCPGVDTIILGIHYLVELEINTVGFTTSFSSQLMKLCLEAGICPNCYVDLVRKDVKN
jgi:hypothetical protein